MFEDYWNEEMHVLVEFVPAVRRRVSIDAASQIGLRQEEVKPEDVEIQGQN